MEKACNFLESINKNEKIEKIEEIDLMTYICDNTDGILDPLDQITYRHERGSGYLRQCGSPERCTLMKNVSAKLFG